MLVCVGKGGGAWTTAGRGRVLIPRLYYREAGGPPHRLSRPYFGQAAPFALVHICMHSGGHAARCACMPATPSLLPCPFLMPLPPPPCSGGDRLLSRSLQLCANISFTDPGHWHDLLLLRRAAEASNAAATHADGPSRSEAVHKAVPTRGLSQPLARSLPTSAGGDPEQQTVSPAGDGGGDGRSALIAAFAREAAGGPLATPEAYFEHFAVFDPKRHKVRPGSSV